MEFRKGPVENLALTQDFWLGRRVFVTGHTGFKGSWLCLTLKLLGAKIHGYALKPPTEPNLFEVADVERGMTSTIGDVRDYQTLKNSLEACNPEVVFHLAAQPLVRESYETPVETYATNVMGSVHLFEAIRHLPMASRTIVNITSDKCYENTGWVWGYREIDALGGHDPYSNSKACAELVSKAFRESFFQETQQIHLATARAGNVIGGGDWAKDRLVPDIFRAFAANEAVVIRNPISVRPWQHVMECVSGYLHLAHSLATTGSSFSEPWNFGPSPDDVKTVQWIVEKLVQTWGKNAQWKTDSSTRNPHEARHLSLDSTKAQIRLGWRPKWNLEQTLQHTAEWYKNYYDGYDMKKKTLSQIESYLSFES